jgi:DNA-binding CsgD family transcriptional regulator
MTRLTNSDFVTLKLISNGLENKEIAKIKGIKEQSVKNDVRKFFEILGAKNRAHLVRKAFEKRLIG